MIVLYDKKETKFKTMGIGVLKDFISNPTTTEVLNGEYYLEFEYPDDGRYIDSIKEENIVKANGQCFRIKNIKKNLKSIIVLAKHLFYDLGNCLLEDVYPQEKNAQDALEWMLSKTIPSNNFVVNGDCTSLSSARYVRKTVLDAIFKEDNSLLVRFGGELSYDNFKITVNKKRGKSKGIDIRFSKNLNGIDYELDFSNVSTKLMPIGKDGILLPEKYVDSDKINDYLTPIVKTIDVNIGIDEETSEAEAYQQMRDVCKEYFSAGGDVPSVSIKIDFIELSKTIEYKKYKNMETINLGDNCRVYVPGLNVDIEARVVKIVRDNVLNKVVNAELGNVRIDFVSSQKKETNNIKNQLQDIDKDSILKEAIENANEMIKHPFGGHLYFDENTGAIYIMDTNDPKTAKDVWCWNMGGFGFSSTGINGDYKTAITQDGSIVADFISTGKLQTSVIEGWESLITRIGKIEKTIEDIDTSLYHADITSSGTSITRDISSIVITAKLLNGSTEIETVESSFIWKRVSSNTSDDATWNNTHKGKKLITITSDDLEASANFHCEVATAEWSGNTSSITIVDEVKSQVPIGHLTANQPDTQTLDESGNVTPVWGLTLTPSIQLGIFSPNIDDFTTTWKRRVESGEITELVAGETVTNNVLSVNNNVLSNDVRSITYYCYIKYQYSTCMTEKTFTLVKDGSSGSDGVSIVRESTTVLYAVNNSSTEPPTTGWITTQPSRSAGQYIWQKMRIAYSDGTITETDAACITGDKGDKGEDGAPGLDGLQGPKGETGLPGKDGVNGKTQYTHIAYATNSTGTSGFSISDSANKTYIGMYVNFLEVDSTDPSLYKWTLIKGADGAQGTPGKAGADGKTPYLHIAYANNATGTSGFSTTDSVNKLYIGQYTDFVSADSTDPTKYAWSKIKGEDGTIKSSTEPTDKTMMWLDTSVTPNILKYWDGTSWVMANDQIVDINGAVNNATNEINKTIEKTNEKIDNLNSSVSTISETVNKQSGSISETSKKVSELEQTVDGWKSSITKISTIEDKLTGAVMKKELSVYLRFYEESGSPVVNLGSSESKTQNFITNEGMRVEVNGVMQTIINSAGLNTNQIITKKILFENNHAMYTNAAKQLIIQ
ncbi:MAG: phage tail protein [Candidatus Izemoplasmatales bacterium]|nr:phage tail protein [Candidatus Izemoplasmatales bacterium]